MAGKLQAIQDMFDGGILCKCPWAEAFGDDPFTGEEKVIRWIIHRENCEGAEKCLELINA